MCIAQAIIRGTSLNRCLLLANIVGFTKECKWGEVAECLYLSSTIFTLYCWIPPFSRNLDGVDSMNNVDDDVELLLLFETSQRTPKSELKCKSYAQNRERLKSGNLFFLFSTGGSTGCLRGS